MAKIAVTNNLSFPYLMWVMPPNFTGVSSPQLIQPGLNSVDQNYAYLWAYQNADSQVLLGSGVIVAGWQNPLIFRTTVPTIVPPTPTPPVTPPVTPPANIPVIIGGQVYSLITSVPLTSGQVVATAQAANNPTSWSITAGDPSANFSISNMGVITLTASGSGALQGFARSVG